MQLPIVLYGDPVLRQVAKDITQEYKDLPLLIENMFETMSGAEGVGLAAPQIGRPIRLFVIDASVLGEEYPELENFKKVFINAEIYERFGEEEIIEEGCLSLPTVREDVKRLDSIAISYYDENWVLHEEEYSGFGARIIQHEYDHIDGKMFVDHCSPLRRRLLKAKLQRIATGKVSTFYRVRPPRA